jgi:hypothetical protein
MLTAVQGDRLLGAGCGGAAAGQCTAEEDYPGEDGGGPPRQAQEAAPGQTALIRLLAAVTAVRADRLAPSLAEKLR